MDCFRMYSSQTLLNIFNKMSIDSVDIQLLKLLIFVFLNFNIHLVVLLLWKLLLIYSSYAQRLWLDFLLLVPHQYCHLRWFLRRFNRWIMDMECSARCACRPSGEVPGTCRSKAPKIWSLHMLPRLKKWQSAKQELLVLYYWPENLSVIHHATIWSASLCIWQAYMPKNFITVRISCCCCTLFWIFELVFAGISFSLPMKLIKKVKCLILFLIIKENSFHKWIGFNHWRPWCLKNGS